MALVKPVRLARRNLRKLTYTGDSPETIDRILREMFEEAEGLVDDLREAFE